jgi:hypothetical protein
MVWFLSVEKFEIFLTYFWFRRTMKFDTLKPLEGNTKFERNNFGVTLIVRNNEADNKLILKNSYKQKLVTSEYFNQNTCNTEKCLSHETRTNTKISDCNMKDKPWWTLGAGVLLHQKQSIHPWDVGFRYLRVHEI